jgi:phage terminase small subunit
MAKTNDFGGGFLDPQGESIVAMLREHCASLGEENIDHLELAMLANSFAMYAKAAKICSEDGVSMTIITEKGSEYSQIRPEYTVMKTEYQNILKHGVKFGLNPASREQIFRRISKKDGKPKSGAFDTETPLKIAK